MKQEQQINSEYEFDFNNIQRLEIDSETDKEWDRQCGFDEEGFRVELKTEREEEINGYD